MTSNPSKNSGRWMRGLFALSIGAAVATVSFAGCSGGSGGGGSGGGGGGGSSGGSSGGGVDGTTCGAGSTQCGQSCVDTMTDNANCGSCANACPMGEVCSGGKCATSCGGGTTLCGASCADTKIDPDNCGGCGTKCAAGKSCIAGACANACGNETYCAGGEGGAGYCANTDTDNANCGGCGTKCGQGQVCSAGKCGSACGQGESLCTPDGGVPYCANTASDNQNCGGCGVSCGNGQTGKVCQGGTCQNGCASPDGGTETLCAPEGGPPYCADTSSDDRNCGGCGVACGQGQACISGACSANCGGTDTLCVTDGGAYCANTQTDNANCGACGTACPNGETCAAGKCGVSCPQGSTLCAGADGGSVTCVNTQSDRDNCGGCGVACNGYQACHAGTCALDKILLVTADYAQYVTAVQSGLSATGAFASVATFDATSNTPTVQQLAPYDAVLVWSDYMFLDPATLGDNLATYFDGGGRVVLAQFSAVSGYGITGKFGTVGNGYTLLDTSESYTSVSSSMVLVQPQSPLVSGAATLTATSAWRGTNAPVNGGTIVAKWADGTPLVVSGVVKGRNRADLNMWPTPDSAVPGNSWTGDGFALMKDALLYR